MYGQRNLYSQQPWDYDKQKIVGGWAICPRTLFMKCQQLSKKVFNTFEINVFWMPFNIHKPKDGVNTANHFYGIVV